MAAFREIFYPLDFLKNLLANFRDPENERKVCHQLERKWEPGAEFKTSDLQQVTQALRTSVPYAVFGVKWKPLAPSPVISKGVVSPHRRLGWSCAHCRRAESTQAPGVELCPL